MEHSEYFPDSFFRISVKGLFVKDGKVLLVREHTELWEMPGGGLDFGEDIKEGLRREVKEEMGLTVTKISEKPLYVWTHKYSNNNRNIGWYYSLVLAYRVEFENLDFTATDECEAIEFFSKEDLYKTQLSGQTKEFADIFNPEDFKGEF
ncbi:MAG: NUDIX hydrolase [Patescibacteria group bacterium]